jgi:hypothetical protein
MSEHVDVDTRGDVWLETGLSGEVSVAFSNEGDGGYNGCIECDMSIDSAAAVVRFLMRHFDGLADAVASGEYKEDEV